MTVTDVLLFSLFAHLLQSGTQISVICIRLTNGCSEGDIVIIDFDDVDGYDESTSPTRSRRLISMLSIVVLLITGGFFLQTTLASNITINSSGNVEFGQGLTLTAACSGANVLTVTPNASFTNSSGSGAFYLSSVTVAGIPGGCAGVDFNISVYDSTTSTALSMFNTSSKVATIWNNAGTFQAGTGGTGLSVTSGSGSFTVTFSNPVALASNVAKLSLQSSNHAAYVCATDGVCAVGDTSASGGTIFYYSAAAFTETGTACASNCHYLEYAPLTWMGTSAEGPYNFFQTVSNTYASSLIPGTLDNLGSGYNNTAVLIAAGDTQGAPSRAKAYAGPLGDTTGQWFVPSRNELNALYDSAAKSLSTFNGSDYHTSTQASAGQCKSINFANRSNNSQNCTVNNPYRMRPIRAW